MAGGHRVTVLRFPAGIVVSEVEWEDPAEPADSIAGLILGDVVPASFAAVAHLAPGLRHLVVTLDYLGDDAPSVIAELTALESMSLFGGSASDEGPWRLDDRPCPASPNCRPLSR